MLRAMQDVMYRALHIRPGTHSLDAIVTIHPGRFVKHNSEPTLYLANHTNQLDALVLYGAIRREQKQNFTLRPAIRDDVYLEDGYTCAQRIRSTIAITILTGVGVVPITQPRTRTNKRRNTLYTYSRVLSCGEDLLVFPTGQRTKDGRIDYLEDHLKDQELKPRHIRHLARLVARNGKTLHVQYVNHIYDPLTQKTIITPGERFAAAMRPIRELAEELACCTTVTPLHAYALITQEYETTEARREFPHLLSAIAASGISVFNPLDQEEMLNHILKYVEKEPDRTTWLLNEVAHVFKPEMAGTAS